MYLNLFLLPGVSVKDRLTFHLIYSKATGQVYARMDLTTVVFRLRCAYKMKIMA